jgi:L-seryl-tRNA(Ser) seleniumtransferase
MTNPLFRGIPSVHELIELPALQGLIDKVSHHVVVRNVRSFLTSFREELVSRADDIPLPNASELAERIAHWIAHEQTIRLRPVINATGILLHTGLGRAPLAASAVQAVDAVAQDYAALEVDPESGERSHRVYDAERLLRELTGAEAGIVTNNCAGATLLTLAAIATGREVLVSRGELIEIGGSYRLPEIMAASGAILREVGTTNKTRVSDYEQGCHEQTAAIMKVHTSNYRIVGFTEAPPLSELVSLGRKRRLPVIHDVGSGALVDFSHAGLESEPLVKDSIVQGADLVLFSGDKLLGGPQCGIILGKKELIGRLHKHPLMRPLRVDKMTLAALHATLLEYRSPENAWREIPLLSLLSTSVANLQNRAERLAPQIAATPMVAEATAVAGEAAMGGGSVPGHTIPSWCIAVKPKSMRESDMSMALRTGRPALFPRVHQGMVWVDLRAVFPRQDQQIVEAFQGLGSHSPPEN